MRIISSMFLTMLLATSAISQPWYARGEFNSYGLENPMVVDAGNATHYTAAVTGLIEDSPYNWKLAEEDWSPEMPGVGPGHDGRVYTNAMGEIHFHLYDQTTWNDGWFPNNTRRVGYDDHQQFDWEIVGSFNAWSGPHDSNFGLMDIGNGLHRGTFTFNAGIYDFKFRGVGANELNTWDTSIGTTFDNNGANNTFAVASNGDPWTFELDLPNGRFRYFTTATPPGLAGDHNDDGTVDAADYVVWRKNPAGFGGQQGYDDWRANFGASGAQAGWIARSPQLADMELISRGGGEFGLDITGLTPQTDYEFRIIRSDASASVPSNNMKVRADINGEIDLNFYELASGSWGDGWSPGNTHRVGYEDHDEFNWEIMGSFNAWSTPLVVLTDQGNGLHIGSFTIDTPGSYEFKFRQEGDWNTSIGADFGNNAPNATLATTVASELWQFELDLPNGRWRAFPVVQPVGSAAPEPASVALLMFGAVFILGVRRN
jgi:hypothetical protein